MKSLKIFLGILWLLIFCLPFLAVSQGTGPEPGETFGPIKEILDLVFSPYFADVAGASGVVIIAVPFAIAAFNINKIESERTRKISKQVVSWIVALAIGFIAFFAQWGIYSELTWLEVVFLTFIVGVQANIVQNTPIIKSITDAIEKVLNSGAYNKKKLSKSVK